MTPFKIGWILVIAASVWTGVIFESGEKIQDQILLKQSTSFEIKSSLITNGIGFYKIFMPEFNGEEIFVQILDPNENIVEEEKIQTKMSVGYFDYKDGIYTMKITNISKNTINMQIELGNTNSNGMILSGILILIGAISLIIISYFKLKNYNMAQPDEKIS